jgi:hypothetical protein
MHQYDKSSKWLIQHHGDSILRLAGVLDIVSWQPLPAELVQSRRLPDGLIEVRRHGQAEPDLYVLEIATYPDARVADQVINDTALVYLDRRVLPEVVVLFLHPKGNIEAAGAVNLRSRQGWTDWRLSWRIAKLWEIPAEELLAASDVGLIPWVPLTQFDGPPEPIVLQCRARIDQDAPPDEHENLLAVTQFLTRLRYHDPKLFQLLGGRKAMIESPLLDELKAEWTREATREATRETTRKNILKILEARFGIAARALEAELKTVDEDRLDDLLSLAATCRTLASFRKQLSP